MPIVLVALLDEGTDVWRPIHADHVAGRIFKLSGDITPFDLDETWQFQPHEHVECDVRIGPDGAERLFAVQRAGTDFSR